MPQSFLNHSPSTWNLLFLVVRYVMVALLLAYLTKVFVKRKDVVTDIKGAVLEWQVETYKEIHRWLMGLQRVTAPPSQQEQWFRSLLSSRRFKIGYQGMEFVSFFDTPEKLIQFVTEFHQMLNKEEGFIDETLKQKLISFQIWLDDVIEYLGAKEIFSHFDVDTFHFEYPRAFADEASFDAFYERLIDVNRDHQIYLDDKVSRQLDKSLHLYTLLKLWLDAFCDTERAVVLKVPQERAKRHIGYQAI